MATTTLLRTTVARGGARTSGRQHFVNDGLALLVLLCATVVGLVAGYARAVPFEVGVAGRYNNPYLQLFHEPEIVAGEQQPSYRWTRERSTVIAPGLGRGLWTTRLSLDSPAAAGPPKPVLLEAGSIALVLQLAPQRRMIHLLTPSVGDLGIAIATTTGQYGSDPRPLGVAFFGSTFEPIVSSMAPPLSILLFSLVTLALAFLALRWAGLPVWAATMLPLFGFSVLVWGIAANRAAVGLLMPRLALLAIVGLVAVVLLKMAWQTIVRLGRLEPEPWLLPALLTVFYVGFWIKATGVLYPYSHVIDVPWHMQRTREILGGRLVELYRPGAFSESVMPEKEWGQNRPVIPYSPFFHIFAASFAVFPWRLETTTNIFSVFFDTQRVLLIAAIALGLGLRSRGALLAALLYAITPFTFLLHSWGNVPTTFGIWWTLFSTMLMVLTFGRWHERRIFVLLTAALLMTLLFYTVMAVFMGLFVFLFLCGLPLVDRGAHPRQGRALLGAGLVALALSIVIYYGQYVPLIIERTLPYITQTVVRGEANTGQTVHEPFWSYLSHYVPHLGYTSLPVRYGLWFPVAFGLPGLWLLRKQRLAILTIGVWYIVALVFLVLGSRVSMVDKHIFYVAPALIVCTAAILERWWTRGRLFQGLIASAYLLTFVAAVQLWIWRLQTVG